MDVSAKGLRVLVTAGGAGIGRAIAKTFLEHGARVQVCDVDDKALSSLPKEIFHVKADVASLPDVDKLFEEVKKNLGGLDVLVNNAGVAGPTAKVEDIEPKDWDRCIAVDLSGMFYCTRKAMPMIKGAGGGSIINLSSAAGRLAFPMRTPYSAAKFAVVGFTESLAAEAGPDKVRVNCIQPGVVEGERIDGAFMIGGQPAPSPTLIAARHQMTVDDRDLATGRRALRDRPCGDLRGRGERVREPREASAAVPALEQPRAAEQHDAIVT